ncbi:MAG: CDP-alcohol phosphatidyltransferase family protein [Clostridiales bacterium]
MNQTTNQLSENKIDFHQFRPAANVSIPNVISAIRILMIPVIIWLYLRGQYNLAALMVIISFVSDIVDGYIARHFHQITPLGKVLDPIADKLTQVIITIAMCFTYVQTIPLVIILCAKELLMLILGLAMLKQGGEPISAHWWGKLSTGVFYVGMIMIMLGYDCFPDSLIRLILSCSSNMYKGKL